ncbi:hypothetical protein NIES2111_63670 (plasmid) [Nostoc sp. NIES-2111]|nr:hypothetical protein NIES2111_63670 [Nostoc sp. NIES-2111]
MKRSILLLIPYAPLRFQAISSVIIRRTISVTATAKLVSLSSNDAGVGQRNARAKVLSL